MFEHLAFSIGCYRGLFVVHGLYGQEKGSKLGTQRTKTLLQLWNGVKEGRHRWRSPSFPLMSSTDPIEGHHKKSFVPSKSVRSRLEERNTFFEGKELHFSLIYPFYFSFRCPFGELRWAQFKWEGQKEKIRTDYFRLVTESQFIDLNNA